MPSAYSAAAASLAVLLATAALSQETPVEDPPGVEIQDIPPGEDPLPIDVDLAEEAPGDDPALPEEPFETPDLVDVPEDPVELPDDLVDISEGAVDATVPDVDVSIPDIEPVEDVDVSVEPIAGDLAPSVFDDPAVVSRALDAPPVAELPAPSERRGDYFETEDGARLFYQREGEGRPMLLLHGYPLSGALFGRVRGPLAEDFEVVTLDHRGYGLSEAPAIPDSIETYAEDALALMDHLGLESAVIGGMSMGGPIALAMYDKAPERFDGLILIDTTAADAPPPEKGLWRGVEEVLRSAGKEPVIEALLPDILTGETRLTQPAVSAYLSEMMRGASLDAFIGGAVALAERPDRTGLLPQIDTPTLVLVGLADSLYPLQVSRAMVEALPQATLAIVPGGSHAAIFEAPGRSAAAIADWAESLPAD